MIEINNLIIFNISVMVVLFVRTIILHSVSLDKIQISKLKWLISQYVHSSISIKCLLFNTILHCHLQNSRLEKDVLHPPPPVPPVVAPPVPPVVEEIE